MDSRCFLRISVLFHAILVAVSRPNLELLGNSRSPLWRPSRMVDLSHHFNNSTIYWSEDGRFSLNVTLFNDTQEGWFQEDVIREPTHGGTHLDSPVHFYRGGISVAEIPLERMLGVPVATVDVRDKAARNASYELTAGDLRAWERQHGRLPEGCLLFVNTGWSKLWSNSSAYLGTDADGVRHFPAVHPDAARFVAEERRVYGVGIDTASVDTTEPNLPHRLLFARDVYVIENLRNLDKVPPVGAHAIVSVPKIDGASGSPARVVAILP
uniref:Putative conserved secreted protein n=1 Tax=Ixodes scapularis TaxID=6945 RepID=A0A4D5RQE7_IXOSC